MARSSVCSAERALPTGSRDRARSGKVLSGMPRSKKPAKRHLSRKPQPVADGPPDPPAGPESYEAEVLPGLVPFAVAELRKAGARILTEGESAISFEPAPRATRRQLLNLRRCVAVFVVLRFDAPRPKALLGHAHLRRLTSEIRTVLAESPQGAFNGFRFGAAGEDSPVFRRLAEAIGSEVGLPRREDGELLLRFRPSSKGGWEVLLRLTPRPLSARSWRACNRPGGLNATVAVAAHDMLGVRSRDRYLNLMCGSGTLLIERAQTGDWSEGVGVDNDLYAVACSRENALSAGVEDRLRLVQGDATQLPFESAGFDRLSVDLPWGDAVGGHRENAELYPRMLAEASRVSDTGARMLAITHELRLFEAALARQSDWRQASLVRVFHGGHRPGLFLLEKFGKKP